tara:strand:+ start:352 stop:723 length:372 start_codon:yes stop_codon:yes gene_type:complete
MSDCIDDVIEYHSIDYCKKEQRFISLLPNFQKLRAVRRNSHAPWVHGSSSAPLSRIVNESQGCSHKVRERQPTNQPNRMTKEQLKLAMALIASLDDEAKANAEVYGNWADHLSDQIADDLTDQ